MYTAGPQRIFHALPKKLTNIKSKIRKNHLFFTEDRHYPCHGVSTEGYNPREKQPKSLNLG